ncbi:MAG: homoserine kinase [Elusimicrobia bacterium]|nr:homoserine kinase [Elusimicrobiota bacterium]
MRVRVRVPATSANLGPGFDVLGVALKLYNELEVEYPYKGKKGKPNLIEISGEGKEFLPKDEKNIVWKAMKAVFNTRSKKKRNSHYKFGQFKIKMKNNIPIGSGMGSSAAAHLSGILAANEIIGRKLNKDEIISLGVGFEGHSDNIVSALLGGFCISVLNGGNIKYLKLKTPKLKAVVSSPDFQLPTEKSRKVLPKKVSLSQAVFNCERLSLLVSALQNGSFEMLSTAMEDKIHQPYRARFIPGMKKIFETAINAGAYGAALSGSGPSIIALCDNKSGAKIGRSIEKVWKKYKVKSKYFILDFDKEGAKIWR